MRFPWSRRESPIEQVRAWSDEAIEVISRVSPELAVEVATQVRDHVARGFRAMKTVERTTLEDVVRTVQAGIARAEEMEARR